LKKSGIIRSCKNLLHALWFFLVVSCHNEGTSEYDIVVEHLTGNAAKYWVLDESTIDGQLITPSKCDSAYVLTMRADFTWNEAYLNVQCSPGGNGQWSLNDESNVISIQYISPATGQQEEKHFEIEELSQSILAYQIAENNRLKYVRLRTNQ